MTTWDLQIGALPGIRLIGMGIGQLVPDPDGGRRVVPRAQGADKYETSAVALDWHARPALPVGHA